jgi:hypothetical protein
LFLPVGAQTFIRAARADAEVPKVLQWFASGTGAGFEFDGHDLISKMRTL